MEIYEIVPGKLYQSPAITDWSQVPPDIELVIDLSDIDPNIPNNITYVHWPIQDGPLPDTGVLETFAVIGAEFIDEGKKVLSHCGAGINRSSLMNGSIMAQLGGYPDIVGWIRQHRPGALSNQSFADYLTKLTG